MNTQTQAEKLSFSIQQRIDLADRADAVTALQRTTGITEPQVTRLLLALLGASGGYEQFNASFLLIGKRMSGKRVTDAAHADRCAEDLKVYEQAQKRERYVLLRADRSERKGDSSSWELPAASYILEIERRAKDIMRQQRNRKKEDRIRRGECFDLAASEVLHLIERIPEPPKDTDPADVISINDWEKRADLFERMIFAYAKNARQELTKNHASPEKLQAGYERALFNVQRAWQVPLTPPCASSPDTQEAQGGIYAAPPIEERNGVADSPAETDLGGQVTPLNASQVQSCQQNIKTDLSPTEQGRQAVKLFESVGADLFGVTFKHDPTLEKKDYLTMHADLLKERMTDYIGRGEREGLSVIVRPLADHIIQNDDLNADGLEEWKPFIFRADETSPGRYQGWLALPIGTDAQTRKRIRDRINAKAGKSIDSGATGAGRVPGSLNQKEIRRQPDGTFPRVTTVYSNPGRFVTIEELEAAGQLAPEPPPTPKPKTTKPTINLNGPTVWPDYNLELQWVARKENGEPDRSKADINFCIKARKWGWSEDDIAARLYELSDKAKRRHFAYAEQTARRAAEIVGS